MVSWDVGVAQSVRHLALGFGSGHDLGFVGSVLIEESVSLSLCPNPHRPPPRACSLAKISESLKEVCSH